MIFMQPTIIRDAAVTTRLTSSKYNYMRAQQLEARKKGLLLMHDQESPLLPELNELLVEPPDFKEVPFEDATHKAPKKSADVDKKQPTTDPGAADPEQINQLDPIDDSPPQAVFQTEEIASRPPEF